MEHVLKCLSLESPQSPTVAKRWVATVAQQGPLVLGGADVIPCSTVELALLLHSLFSGTASLLPRSLLKLHPTQTW